jgi:hypothetical protein
VPYFILEQNTFLFEAEILLSLSKCEGSDIWLSFGKGKTHVYLISPFTWGIFCYENRV